MSYFSSYSILSPQLCHPHLSQHMQTPDSSLTTGYPHISQKRISVFIFSFIQSFTSDNFHNRAISRLDFLAVFYSNPIDGHEEKHVYDHHPDENNPYSLLLFHSDHTIYSASFYRLHINLYVNLAYLSVLNSFAQIFL